MGHSGMKWGLDVVKVNSVHQHGLGGGGVGGCHNKERGTGFLMQPLAETRGVLSLSLQQTWAEHRDV